MKIAKSAYIAPGAVVLGDVEMKEDVSIWYHATVRGDKESIFIGRGSNIQDNCVVHTGAEYPVTIGENVTIGHSAVIHGCAIGDNSLIGMGAILMNGSVVGKNCIVGAGALVTEGMKIPDNSVAVGNPAKVVRRTTEEDIAANLRNAASYVEDAKLSVC